MDCAIGPLPGPRVCCGSGSIRTTWCPSSRSPSTYCNTAHVAPPWFGSAAIMPLTMTRRRSRIRTLEPVPSRHPETASVEREIGPSEQLRRQDASAPVQAAVVEDILHVQGYGHPPSESLGRAHVDVDLHRLASEIAWNDRRARPRIWIERAEGCHNRGRIAGLRE